MENWKLNKDETNNLVLSTRIRLARNLKERIFTNKLEVDRAREIINEIEESFFKSYNREDFVVNYLWEKGELENKSFVDSYLISNDLVDNKDKSAFIINKDETVSIMINEEDHIRLQCFDVGLNLKSTYEDASKIDDKLEKNLDYAFDEKLGYLTACPTNLGTGMRASVMVHLPAMTMNDEINGVFKALTRVGVAIRGMHGEGSKPNGAIYQISNQITLGKSEGEIIENLEVVINEILERELITRNKLMETYEDEIYDKINRSVGILQNARILSFNECVDLLSNLRFGVELDIISNINTVTLNKILVDAEPSNIQKTNGKKMSAKERDLARANMVREILIK